MQQRRHDPWKTLGLVIAVAIPALLVTGAVVGMLEDDRRMEELASVVIADSAPPASVAEECNRYAAEVGSEASDTPRDEAAVVSDTDVAAGPQQTAEDGAAARTRGTLVGMSEQTSRSPTAREAFRDCMQRKGYAS